MRASTIRAAGGAAHLDHETDHLADHPLAGEQLEAEPAGTSWSRATSASDVNGERRTSAIGGRSTASWTATAAPSDPPKYTSWAGSTSPRAAR